MEKSLNTYMRQVYLYMLIAIVVTGASALLAIHVFGVVLMSLPAFLVMIAVQLLLVTLIARQISSNSLSKHQIMALFLGFTVLEGVTLSPILALAPTQGVVMATVSSVVLFVVLSMIGLTTKRDLSGWGTMLMASLIAIIIVSLLSLFFIHVTILMTIISIVSVILFAVGVWFPFKEQVVGKSLGALGTIGIVVSEIYKFFTWHVMNITGEVSIHKSIRFAFPEFYIGLIISILMVVTYFVIDKKVSATSVSN